jgi:hypothetical protein
MGDAPPEADPVVIGQGSANTLEALVITDAEGRLLFCGQTRPGFPSEDVNHLKNQRVLSRHVGRREHFDAMLGVVAGLVNRPRFSGGSGVPRIRRSGVVGLVRPR